MHPGPAGRFVIRNPSAMENGGASRKKIRRLNVQSIMGVIGGCILALSACRSALAMATSLALSRRFTPWSPYW
jgi:hypothetical protein